jgi:plastocyanin
MPSKSFPDGVEGVITIQRRGDLECTHASGVMNQKNKEFVPDLLAICAGSTVSFPNLDPIFHNVFSLSRPREFDLGNYPMNKTRLAFPSGTRFTRSRQLTGQTGAS